jgi:hypothetical protein
MSAQPIDPTPPPSPALQMVAARASLVLASLAVIAALLGFTGGEAKLLKKGTLIAGPLGIVAMTLGLVGIRFITGKIGVALSSLVLLAAAVLFVLVSFR